MKLIVYSIVCALFIYSCKKKDKAAPASTTTASSTTSSTQNPPSAPTAADYMPLKVGNYWVYRLYDIDSTGKEFDDGNDSMWISAAITKNGRIYYTLKGIGEEVDMLDSGAETYNDSGQRIFSIADLHDTLSRHYSKDFYWISYIMISGDSIVTVPAGQFHCFDRLGQMVFDQSWRLKDNIRYSNYFFNKGIGIVRMTFQALAIEKLYYDYRLLRYKVQ
jgi:hypothetical protein